MLHLSVAAALRSSSSVKFALIPGIVTVPQPTPLFSKNNDFLLQLVMTKMSNCLCMNSRQEEKKIEIRPLVFNLQESPSGSIDIIIILFLSFLYHANAVIVNSSSLVVHTKAKGNETAQ